MIAVAIVVTRDVDAFAASARHLLESRLECNLLATVLMAVREGQAAAGEVVFAYDDDGRGSDSAPGLAALRVPPRPLLISDFPAEMALPFVERWVAADRRTPGVIGPSDVTHAVAAAWQKVTGEQAIARM